jgi:hypothetical protein
MTRWHAGLAPRFASLPMHQQLLMAVNELNRAHNMQNVPAEYNKALERALELIDMLSLDARWKPALRELRRGRELVAQLYAAPTPASTLTLQKTFVQLNSTAFKLLYPQT